MERLKELHWQILIASAVGLFLGLWCSEWIEWNPNDSTWMQGVEFIGALFLRSLRFVAVPIVLFSLVGGIGALSDLQKLGRIATRTLAFYLLSTAIAISIGLGLSNLLQPGAGLSSATKEVLRTSNADAVSMKVTQAVAPDVWTTILNIIPTNPFAAMAEGNMLQVLFFSVALGMGVATLPEKERTLLVGVFDGLTQVVIRIIQGLMKLAPLAVFCLLLSTGAKLGWDVITILGQYVLTVLLGLGFLAFGLYPLLVKTLTKHSIVQFFKSIAPAQLLAFSSSSSSATMPVTLDCCQDRLHLDTDVSRFVIPLGATVNMDGTALYQGVAAMFIAQTIGLDLTIMNQVTIVLTATLASIGTAGVPGVGLIMLVIVLESIGLSAEQMTMGLSIIFGVDRLLDMSRTVINITSDCTVATIVDAFETED